MPETPAPDQDPVVIQSLSLPLLVVSLLLVLSLVWAVYDEVFGLRPWKRYQERFVKAYTRFLVKAKPRQAAAEKAVRESEEFLKLEQQLLAAEKAIAPRLAAIDSEVNGNITRRLAGLTEVFSLARSQVSSLVYREEVATSPGTKASIQRQIEDVKKGPFKIEFHLGPGSEKVILSYDEMEAEFNHLQQKKAELMAERAELVRPASELRQKRDAYLKDHLPGLTEEQIAGLQRKMEKFQVEIKQIHVKEVDLVDRCESCHLGIREPLTLTKADMGGEGAFTSHPNPSLLQIHNPDRFGCTPCHNGNGTATTSVEKAHGQYQHWLWPLYSKKTAEAGCHQCHNADLYLDQANTLNAGKEFFRNRGCIGCHRYEGFDVEAEALLNARQAIRRVEAERQQTTKLVGVTIKNADTASDNSEAQKLYARADALRQDISVMDHHLEQLDTQSRSLLREQKKVGPSLKEVRVKMHKEWIPVWLEDPHVFRPTTKMPTFRLNTEQRHAIAAFIWQSGVVGQLPQQKPGDAARGKELLETRGCLGCHSMGEGCPNIRWNLRRKFVPRG